MPWMTFPKFSHLTTLMQMWRMDSDVLAYTDLETKMKNGHKEKSVLQTSFFDVADFFLDRKHAKTSVGEKLDMFFYDADVMPLHIHVRAPSSCMQQQYEGVDCDSIPTYRS